MANRDAAGGRYNMRTRDTTTPASSSFHNVPALRSTAKRSSLQAELERDPQLSTAKRQQRTQALASQMSHASLERQLFTAQTVQHELQSKLREHELTIERLERDRRFLADREKEEREEKEQERAAADEQKGKMENELRSLRTALSSLQERYADLEDAHSSFSKSASHTMTSQRSQIATLTHQITTFEAEVSEFKQIATERSRTIQELQERLDQLGASKESMESKKSEEESWTVVREELHRQAHYLRTIESVNAKLNAELAVLREKHQNMEILKEENRALGRKLQNMEEIRDKMVRLEAEVQAARREREEWASKGVVDDGSPSKTPVSITKDLSDLRLAHARLLEEHGATVAVLRSRESNLGTAEQRVEEVLQEVEDSKQRIRALQDTIARTGHKASLAEREASFLQALVASFSAEDASMDTVHVDEAKLKKVHDLEQLVQEYKTTIRSLEHEIISLGGDTASAGKGKSHKDLVAELQAERSAKIAAEKALRETEASSKTQLERIDELEQELFELQGEIGAGRHIPPGIRILCLKDNPAQQWEDLSQAALDQLKAENEALIKRLKELEESGARGNVDGQSLHAEELVPRESWESVMKEKKELDELVKQKEKRLLRLQQVFTAKSAEFREAIASILGVKLAFYPNGQVRVTSLYDLSASFVFQPTSKSPNAEGEGMKMQLVAQGEGGPQDLPQMMRYWVEEQQCIPGFLASITLECYDQMKKAPVENAIS